MAVVTVVALVLVLVLVVMVLMVVMVVVIVVVIEVHKPCAGQCRLRIVGLSPELYRGLESRGGGE